jgi:hypothetical protein
VARPRSPHHATTMTSPEGQLLATRREEAAALLAINQRTRGLATGILTASLIIALTAGLVALASHKSAVLIPVPSVLLLLSALAFQQFAEVSVTGAARRLLEHAINSHLDGTGLLYETHLARIRKRQPLVGSVRVLQCVWAAGVLGMIGAGGIAAYEQPAAWPPVPYTVFTIASMLACGSSYRDMLRSGQTAASALKDANVL